MKVDKRSELKQGQIDILELLYKYRFGSRQLLAESLGVKAESLFRRLEVLIKHNYVNKRQDKKLKLLGTPIAYYLTPKGLRTLQELPKYEHITDSIIKYSYKDKTVSQSFVNHILSTYSLTNELMRLHSGLKVFLRRDMSRYSYFPDNPPDAFLSLKSDNKTNRFFLDVISSSQERKQIFQKISSYINFFNEGGWSVTEVEQPKLLLICENPSMERIARRMARGAISNNEPDEELEVYTTTNKALSNMDKEALIWTGLDDDEPYPLIDL